MRKVYWRPQKVSNRVLWLVFASALFCYLIVVRFEIKNVKPDFKKKIEAARLAQSAFDFLRQERLRRGIMIDEEADPAGSGLIGDLSSAVTTNVGHLPAKRSSVNPNFAAVVFHYLKSLGVGRGDQVAVGISGSFPAMNVATFAAIEVIGARPVIISSAGASQWGANNPSFMWPDMENLLFKNKLFTFRSSAMTLGGIDDKALGISAEGRKAIEDSILMNGYELIKVKNYQDSVEKKMDLYLRLCGDAKPKVYINVGGGTTSVGTKLGKYKFAAGINTRPPPGTSGIDSIMTRFINDGVPVVHLTKIEDLSARYGFPEQPKETPPVGDGKIYATQEPNRILALAMLAAIFAVIYALTRLDWGFRLLGNSKEQSGDAPPEQMV